MYQSADVRRNEMQLSGLTKLILFEWELNDSHLGDNFNFSGARDNRKMMKCSVSMYIKVHKSVEKKMQLSGFTKLILFELELNDSHLGDNFRFSAPVIIGR